MNGDSFARLRLTAEVWVWRMGWGLPLALLLAITCVLLWALVVTPQRERRTDLELRTVKLASETGPRSSLAPPDPQSVAWQRIRTGLPSNPGADQLVARMLALARENGVGLEQADFEYRNDGEMLWLQVSALVPIRGSYPAARRFIDATLREHPNVALDEVRFKRESAGASQPEVVVRFSAWFQVEGRGR